jgi:2-oxoglutarate dehydrogenase E2 component (dihydrolipoamide succinyltransferase)
MSHQFELTLPKLGESIQGATVVQWLKKEGESVRLDEPLLEVSTDKVNSEIPSPVAGILQKVLVKEDQEVATGAPLAVISVQEESITHSLPKVETAALLPSCAQNKKEKIESNQFFSPGVMRLAQIEALPTDVLMKIEGSGVQGRVTKKDVENYLKTRTEEPSPSILEEHTQQQLDQKPIGTGESMEERVKMSRMRKAIADNMVRSFYEAPHASVMVEVDVTDVMELIKREKNRFLEMHRAKLTITSFLIQALSKALTQFPTLNASLEQEEIVLKRYINIGMAVNVEGGLVVPVLKNCQDRNLASIAKAVFDLSTRAREHKLAPDEVRGGTITLTNFGTSKALMGVPIIRHPEVAIVGAGTVQKRVVVREDDSFAIRQMIYLTLTFDHRLIDGILACEFLASMKLSLEQH